MAQLSLKVLLLLKYQVVELEDNSLLLLLILIKGEHIQYWLQGLPQTQYLLHLVLVSSFPYQLQMDAKMEGQ